MNKFLQATLLSLSLFLFSFSKKITPDKNPDTTVTQTQWVDSVFASLNTDQKIAQLFMVAAYSNRDMKHVREIKELITKYNIGGLIWMQGGPVREAKLATYYQSVSKTPLLYSIDGEWGLAMRLDSTPRYPRQMTLGAIQNDSLIYLMGKQIAKECKRMGIHVNFAPVADVNSNPNNPVIGMRSFGENKYLVAQKAFMYMKGMQDEFVMANGKHFPGHGDTDSDSHLGLPKISHSLQRLDTLELYPFKYLFERGLGSVMVAHLNIPSLDSTKNLASTLSPKVVNELLKNKLNYKGLIFTDALNMKGVADYYAPGIVDAMALLAGNDVLLFSGDVAKAIEAIKTAIQDGLITQAEIDNRCKKILQAKFWCGLNKKQEISTRNLFEDLNSNYSKELNNKLAQAAITVLKNENNFLPIKNLDTLKIAEIAIGTDDANEFTSTLKTNFTLEHFGLNSNFNNESAQKLLNKIQSFNTVIIQLNKTSMKPENNFGLTEQSFKLIDSISKMKPTILVLFSNPYLLNKFKNIQNFKSIILAYENIPSLLAAAANVVAGQNEASGKIPVSTTYFKSGFGINLIGNPNTTKQQSSNFNFKAVDSIALWGIQQKAYPGCQIVALKNGEVVYQKSFGKMTYQKHAHKVENSTVYDIASVTKITASALALMKLTSENKFDYHQTLGFYLPELKNSNKENLLIEDVLAHQAGLQAWIPYYQSTIGKKGKYKQGYYSKHKSEQFPIQVAENLFVVQNFEDTIIKKIIDSKLEKQGEYVYSDLGYYLMKRIIEKQTGKKLDEYVAELYSKIGTQLTYRPSNYYSKKNIAPTENDLVFRKQLVHGYVHDPGAALMGGVAGHAGIFGNALDVAVLMQLYLNKGEINGVRILDSNVVKDYTSCHYCPKNRRGLCFEKPELDDKKDSPVCSACSPESFGHAGFTGTLAWADPKNKLVYVFLSNRVNPDANENKLAKLAIRGKIHKAFYDSFK